MKYIINNIYDTLYICYNDINKLTISKNIKKFKLKDEDIENNFFFPLIIKNWIIKNINIKVNYSFYIKNLFINLNFYTDDISNIKKKYIIKISTLLNYFNYYYDNTCFQNLYIDIYLTPFKKFLPENKNNNISPININSGFSYHGCSKNKKIVVYRSEEWFKVLIHELMHTYNLDFSIDNNYKLKNRLKNIYKINSIYDINETYCESWARILNIIFYCFFKERKENSKNSKIKNRITNKNKFFVLFDKIIILEQKFYLEQIKKLKTFVYDFNYKEVTNVFCYYILTYCVMMNYKLFLKWCNTNNKYLLNFIESKKNIDLFIKLLENNYNNINIHKYHTDDNINIHKYHTDDNIKKDNSIKMTMI